MSNRKRKDREGPGTREGQFDSDANNVSLDDVQQAWGTTVESLDHFVRSMEVVAEQRKHARKEAHAMKRWKRNRRDRDNGRD